MTVLRSREVKSTLLPLHNNNNNNSPNSKNKQEARVSSIEPQTPCNTRESNSSSMMDGNGSGSGSGAGSSVRRSLRLASKSSGEKMNCVLSEKSRKRKSVESEVDVELENAVVEDSVESDDDDEKEGNLGFGVEESGMEGISEVSKKVESGVGSGEGLNKGKGKRKLGFESDEGDGGCLRLRSGKKVVARGFVVENVEVLERGNNTRGGGGGTGNGDMGDLKSGFDGEVKVDLGKLERLDDADQGQSEETVRISDEGQGRLSREDNKGKGKLIDMVDEPEVPQVEVSNSDDGVVKKDGSEKNGLIGIDAIADRYRAIMAKRNKGSKGDGVDVWDELISKCVESMKSVLSKTGKVRHSPRRGKERAARNETIGPSDVSRRLSIKEKGKGKLDETPGGVEISTSGNVVMQDGMQETPRTEISNSDTAHIRNTQLNDGGDQASRARDRFRAQARKSASRFAFFSTTEGEQNHVVGEAEAEMAPREMNNESEIEDWPGPFSTAMKIIKERGMNVNLQHKNVSSGKDSQVMWIPKQDKNCKRSNFPVPPLQELCMRTLTKNADAITSLDYVPDPLRHKLSHMLCDMRRMNGHFLELLVRGSPTEIRIRDCSWLSEEEFTKIFAGADINNLAVLQLDQCGRCMPDYILYSTLGRSPNCLPLLTTLSLKGACRLSDIGLSSLLSSAPALRSINLSQCSLLTSGGINNIADSLGSVLRELYVDDCESIDPFLMLPALSKLEYLEVLSLAGFHTVCDDFICQLIALRGRTLKELVLADCVNLTDISLKVISKSCSGICALDLTNVCKLTDSALGYLANGCQLIRSLKLRRNIFSDEAVAAYLETSGGSLEEFSLNNISKVAYNTAISLSKCSKNLQNLDLSFCRNMSNEAVGLIVDSCLSLKTLKLFGCTQVTDIFLDGHSNEQVQVIGLQMTPILGNIKVPELLGPLRYS